MSLANCLFSMFREVIPMDVCAETITKMLDPVDRWILYQVSKDFMFALADRVSSTDHPEEIILLPPRTKIRIVGTRLSDISLLVLRYYHGDKKLFSGELFKTTKLIEGVFGDPAELYLPSDPDQKISATMREYLSGLVPDENHVPAEILGILARGKIYSWPVTVHRVMALYYYGVRPCTYVKNNKFYHSGDFAWLQRRHPLYMICLTILTEVCLMAWKVASMVDLVKYVPRNHPHLHLMTSLGLGTYSKYLRLVDAN